MDRLYICIHIDKIYVWIVTHHFLHSCTRVMALGLRQIFGSIQYLENNWIEFHPHFTRSTLGCYTSFWHICTRVMALDLGQNFLSVQYLQNKWTEFHQILYMQSY